jgi:hypothetical protein
MRDALGAPGHVQGKRKMKELQILLLLLSIPALAQKDPAPILQPGQAVPATGNQRVFLTPQKDTVILVLPPHEEGGNTTTPEIVRLPIHIRFEASLSVRLSHKDDSVNYQYELQNAALSMDSINTLWFVVNCGDTDLELRSKDPRWVGTRSVTPVARSAVGEDSWQGCYASWIGEGANTLPPSRTVTNLTMTSRYLPGLTTAYVMHFPTIDIADDLPEEVLSQLEPVAHPTWSSKHPAIIGPRYALNTPKAVIADDFRKGIKALVTERVLDRSSPAVEELSEILANVGPSADPQTILHSHPVNPLERALLGAVSLSLGFRWLEDLPVK